jgi:signal transduction histidine kinase
MGGSTLGWSIGVTALVAVLFEPVRSRAQRRVNRLVFGRRAAPYEVLAELTERLASTERDDGLFGRMATRLADGTGAERAIVWVADGTGFRPAAVAPYMENPGSAPDPVPTRPDDLPGLAVPIVEDGETLGALSVEPQRGVTLTATERRLVEDLAGSVGLVMRRLRLDAELRHQASLLQESRRRLVDAQELERRRLQRRLDDDARQRVLNLRSKLDSTRALARREGSDRTAELIAEMAAETDDAMDQIQALVRGLHPPLLEAEGLGAAVTALSESAPIAVHVEVATLGRHPLPVEVAAYFCISEALTNVLKHGDVPISIIVRGDAGGLSFTVTDSGPGFDPDAVVEGSGLRNMTDRVEQVGGTISVDSRPGRSTTISGRLPVDAPVPVPVGGLTP